MINAFLRNDDVRDFLEESLTYLTYKTTENNIPITLAVEPANVKSVVVDWLLEVKQKDSHLIELIQHGYDHRIKTALPERGEFGRGRAYSEQLSDIRRGADLMDTYFGDSWSRIFSFPYGTYDQLTLRALHETGFKAITTGIKPSFKRLAFNKFGQLLHRNFLFQRNIVYFNQKLPHFPIFALPVVMNNTIKQTGPDSGRQKSSAVLLKEWRKLPGFLKTRGILCHHRFNAKEDIDHLILFLNQLKTEGVKFSLLEKFV